MNYCDFIKALDKKLEQYFLEQKENILCREGCSFCCEKGDYPLSETELEYLMQGYIALNSETKRIVQKNIKEMVKGGKCPFLIEGKCSVYFYRPIICRTHGLAYICGDNVVKLPYCANMGMNYKNCYSDGEFTGVPVKENLDRLLPNGGEVRNLYDWLKTTENFV